MSNFTRSIMYSTTVMVAGLVGIFTIYNNVSPLNDGSSLAQISPAANKSDIGIDFTDALEHGEESPIEATEIDDNASNARPSSVEDIAKSLSELETISHTVGEVSEEDAKMEEHHKAMKKDMADKSFTTSNKEETVTEAMDNMPE